VSSRDPSPVRGLALALCLIGALAPGCRTQSLTTEGIAPPEARGRTSPHLHVVMVNGGGNKNINYQSHLLHVQHLHDLLVRTGVRPERITVFSGDGADPAEDLAVREGQRERDFWLLRGTRLEYPLATPITYANSTVPGTTLRPATREELRRWFKRAHRELKSGDTLLLYVTDHGTKAKDDSTNTSITLWGTDESLPVNELREQLALLDPGVRVVMLMSQCYSGGFSHLVSTAGPDALPRGNICGYFSSTADRPAYGCYPENKGRENVGHSFHFIQALATIRPFPDAHQQVLVTDASPDVPLRTSDTYLDDLLHRKAKERGQDPAVMIDGLLHEAWKDKAAWEPEIRLLDRIGHAYGSFSPRSLAELEGIHLGDITDKLKTYKGAWETSLKSLTSENLDRFLEAEPDWKPRLAPETIASLDTSGKQALTKALLGDLDPYTTRDTATEARFTVLRKKTEVATTASYRMEVRLGVGLRMRAILTTIAGRVYLAKAGTPEERAAHQALVDCEGLTLDPAVGATTVLAAAPEPYPPFEDDVKLAEKVLPAWMGIHFKPPDEQVRKTAGLSKGAASVEAVYPDSPAKKAGFKTGDIVLGPPGAFFSEPQQIREWTMLSKIDEPTPIMVLRGDKRMHLTLVPKPYPISWSTTAGPPKVDAPAPAVKLSSYRGAVPAAFADGHPHLLFFWATYCAPCKASLPEVLAFERERKTQVIAITDELDEQLDTFFKKFSAPFPATVAMDGYRQAFQAYGVSGTPTFVLLDGAGKVKSYATGYSPEKGIGVAGWTFTTAPAPAGG
jgi:thiol-disulfide isomerase/thioredoxin